MRIFTLGKNGIPLFFFALILLSGAHSYGQQVDSCGVTDQNTDATGNQQYFCDSQEAELNDLLVEGTDITFYSDSGYSDELDATTLLIGGTTYYIDVDGCQSSVTVTIFNQPQILGVEEDALTRRPEANTKQSLGTLDICVSDVNNPNIFVSDLRTSAPEDSVQWYRSATATGTPQPIDNPSTEELENGVYYYAARVYEDPVDSQLNCTTNRSRTRVLLTEVEAPAADAEQEFCSSDAPTLADIVAEGDNRYYATATSQVELSQNTPLEDGETYFVSSVGVSCESSARTAVTVELQDVEAGEQVGDGEYCLSEIQERLAQGATARQLFIELLEPEVPTNGTFSNSTISEIEVAFNNDPTQTYTTTYTITNDLGCEDSVDLSITVTEDPNAGDDANLVFCQSEAEALVNGFLEDPTQSPEAYLAEWIGDRDTNGTFSGDPLQSIITQYTSNSWPIEVSTTYAVGEGACEDTAEISITITEDVNLEPSYSGEICNAGLDERINSADQVRELFTDLLPAGVPTNGTFSPSISNIISQYQNNPIGSFTTTYTVGEGNCEASTEVTITIIEPTEANAGNIDDITLGCSSTSVFVLDNAVLGADSTPGGTFSAADGVLNENGNFDPSIGTGDYEITYTVSGEDDPCITGSASTTFIITVSEGDFNAGSPNTGVVCESDVDSTFSSIPAIRTYLLGLLDQEVPTNGSFSPSHTELYSMYQNDADGLGDFTTTYTVGNGECEASVDLTIRIIPIEDADAGEIENIVLECNDNDIVILDDSILSDGATTGGVFTGEGINEDGNFDPTVGIGVYTITYSVDDSANCVTEGTQDSTSFNITVTGNAFAGNANTGIVCESDVQSTFPDLPSTRSYFLSLLDQGVPTTGSFSPSISQIITMYQNDEDGLGNFTTTYTVVDGSCEASVELTASIVPIEDADAGEIADQTVCRTLELINLSNFLTTDATTGGVFTGTGVDEEGMFTATTAGVYTITYTVDDSADCVTPGTEDSTTFEIEVLEGVDLGEDLSETICQTDVMEDLEMGDFEAYFINLIEGLPADGTFSPSLATLYSDYTTDMTQTFTTTYSVEGETCVSSVQVSLTITAEQDANAGDIADQSVCATDDLIALGTYLPSDATMGGTFTGTGVDDEGMFDASVGVGSYTITYLVDDTANCVTPGTEDSTTFEIEVLEAPDAGEDNSTELCNASIQAGLFEGNVELLRAFYLDLLDEGVSREGTFTTNLQDLIDRYDSGDEIGAFTAVYTVFNENCEDSVELTLNVIEGEAPNAGEDVVLVFCSTDGPQDLYEFLAEGASTEGTFADLEDGIFDPSTMEAGEYTYEYSVTTTGECGGTDTATVTITVTDAPVAPEVEDAVFCVSQGATVADLDAGANLMWYTDEALENPALAEDMLVEGPYYVTQTNEGGCESVATTVTVTLDDTAAPTLAQGGNVFCEFDNPTIADLENNIVESGDINWYDAATGGELLSTADLLENGMTYYASLTDATSTCESSTRLAVTVTLETCELVIPEAFSPNSDGINDRFEVENLAGEYPNYNMEIYNRWGNKVFTGNSSNPSWDGTSDDGSLGDGVLPVGVYFYILNFNDGQTAPIQGRVYLSR